MNETTYDRALLVAEAAGRKAAEDRQPLETNPYTRKDYAGAWLVGHADYKKPHASPSQLGLYFKCGEAYRRRYIEKERRPPGFAMLRGRGVHAAAEHNFRQKVDSHVDLSRAEIIDAGVAGFEIGLETEGVALSDDEAAVGMTLVKADTKDQVARMSAAHADQQAPEYQPIIVEQTIRIELPRASRDLLGVVDVIVEGEASPKVVDFKTAKARKNAADLNADVALTFYAGAASALLKQPISDVRLDILLDQKRGVQRQVIDEKRTTADFGVLSHRMNAFLSGVDAGVFPPAPPGAWWCSPKWCGFWNDCPYINSERTAAAKDFAV